jgi:hypothetical protein
MQWLGWGDASVTPPGRDGGIDVIATHAVAQVKAHVNPIGRPEIQQLFGIAASLSRAALFFAASGYSPEAKMWADQVSMALFRFDLQGEPQPENAIARNLWEYGAFPSETSDPSDEADPKSIGFCSSCGERSIPDTRFCGACGTDLNER